MIPGEDAVRTAPVRSDRAQQQIESISGSNGLQLVVDLGGNPEAGVAGVMRRRGYRVFFTENTLRHSLFGLLFWDELFEVELLHSSFDWVPHCLKDRSFARRFNVIDARPC